MYGLRESASKGMWVVDVIGPKRECFSETTLVLPQASPENFLANGFGYHREDKKYLFTVLACSDSQVRGGKAWFISHPGVCVLSC